HVRAAVDCARRDGEMRAVELRFRPFTVDGDRGQRGPAKIDDHVARLLRGEVDVDVAAGRVRLLEREREIVGDVAQPRGAARGELSRDAGAGERIWRAARRGYEHDGGEHRPERSVSK